MDFYVFHRYLRVFRALLFALSCTAICSWVCWAFFPSKINSLGRYLQKSITQPVQKEFSSAQKALKQSDEGPFEKLLSRLDDIRRGDRLERFKDIAFEKLCDFHISKKNLDKLDRLSTDWLKYDANSINAFRCRYYVLKLSKSPDLPGYIERLYSKMGNVPVITHLYADFLYSNNQREKAIIVEKRALSQRPSLEKLEWRLFYRGKGPFQGSQSIDLVPSPAGKRRLFEFQVPEGTAHIRIDFPPFDDLVVSDLRLEEPLQKDDLWVPEKIKTHQAQWNGNMIASQSHQNDPFFYFELPQVISQEKSLKISFLLKRELQFQDSRGAQ